MTPQELLNCRNLVARAVVSALAESEEADFMTSQNPDNIYAPVARVDLGDGYWVDVIVQPQLDA